jgi:TRAP-type C4-dicarboxylate transport system permease small subunit
MSKKLDQFEEYAIAVCIVLVAILQTFNAICKILNLGIAGIPEEIGKFLYVYICFFSMAFCAKKGCNVAVQMISDKYGANAQKPLAVIRYIADIIIAIILFYGAIGYETSVIAEGTVGKVSGIPMSIVGLAAIVGCALCLIRNLQGLMNTSKEK